MSKEKNMLGITGATGLVGKFFLEILTQNEYNMSEVSCLVRHESQQVDYLKSLGVQICYGDITRDSDLEDFIKGKSLIVHIVHMTHSERVYKLCHKYQIDKVVLIHTTGMYSKYRKYSNKYVDIEKRVMDFAKSTTTNYVILRPTMIYGTLEDKNMNQLIRFISTHSFIPIFGRGKGLMQPIHGRDIAEAIFRVLQKDIRNKSYNLAGRMPLQYRDIIQTIANHVNPKIRILRIPFVISIFLGSCYNGICSCTKRKAKVTVEQILRLNEDKSYSYEEAEKDFGFSPMDFREGILIEIEQMTLSKEP
jgi:nucleoside-diphosphate-sugar epimerase